jgi:hypothetical protein
VGLADNGFFTVAPYRELFLARAQTMYSVEIGCDAEDLATVMSEMREWLDAQRFERASRAPSPPTEAPGS